MIEIVHGFASSTFSLNIFLLLFSLILYKKNKIKGFKEFISILFISSIVNLLIVLLTMNPNNNIYMNFIIQRHIYVFALINYFVWIIWEDTLFKIFSQKYKIMIGIIILIYILLLIFKANYLFNIKKIILYKGFINIHPRTVINNIISSGLAIFIIIIPMIKVFKKIKKEKYPNTFLKVFLVFAGFTVFGGTLDFLEITLPIPFLFSIGFIISFFLIGVIFFNDYSSKLEENIKREVIMDELKKAIKVKETIIPDKLIINNDKISLIARIIPSGLFSGDFYYCNFLTEDKIVFAVGDVSGKGIPASIITSIVYSLLRFGFEHIHKDVNYITKINNYLINTIRDIFMVTIFIGIIDLKKKKLFYINAGHSTPILYNRKNFSVKFLDTEKIKAPLGIYLDYEYKYETIKLSENDSLFVYTDGLTDVNNDTHKFIEETLLKSIKKYISTKDEEFLNLILNEANIYERNIDNLFDDITLLNIDLK